MNILFHANGNQRERGRLYLYQRTEKPSLDDRELHSGAAPTGVTQGSESQGPHSQQLQMSSARRSERRARFQRGHRLHSWDRDAPSADATETGVRTQAMTWAGQRVSPMGRGGGETQEGVGKGLWRCRGTRSLRRGWEASLLLSVWTWQVHLGHPVPGPWPRALGCPSWSPGG